MSISKPQRTHPDTFTPQGTIDIRECCQSFLLCESLGWMNVAIDLDPTLR